MHIHILGICGTFMGGIAAIAKSLGHKVTGSDQNVYPPMSTQLEDLGIELTQGYDVSQLEPKPDMVVIGNAMSRGNPCVEYVLDNSLPYTSGPEWLKHNLLQNSWVLAVAGTHGKTTTASMLAWILEYAGLKPGFLIGGIVQNFGVSAKVGETPFFVIEADEYDTAFFDKRSKFIHYHPRTLVMNNLEFDHADIFDDLAAIERQFHHLVRTVPATGLIIYPVDNSALQRVIGQGCWSDQALLNHAGGWMTEAILGDCSQFNVLHHSETVATVTWQLSGEHNMANALAAIVAARHVGVEPKTAAAALAEFQSVKRRMELVGEVNGIRLYDDFAHHPTAIKLTLAGARAKGIVEKRQGRLLAVLEPRSNTMKMGEHKEALAASVADADSTFWLAPEGLSWSLTEAVAEMPQQTVCHSIEELEKHLLAEIQAGDDVVIMSNGSFSGLHLSLLSQLKAQYLAVQIEQLS